MSDHVGRYSISSPLLHVRAWPHGHAHSFLGRRCSTSRNLGDGNRPRYGGTERKQSKKFSRRCKVSSLAHMVLSTRCWAVGRSPRLRMSLPATRSLFMRIPQSIAAASTALPTVRTFKAQDRSLSTAGIPTSFSSRHTSGRTVRMPCARGRRRISSLMVVLRPGGWVFHQEMHTTDQGSSASMRLRRRRFASTNG